MPLFKRIFQPKRQQNGDKSGKTESETPGPKEFGKNSFRVVIYKDHDIKGRSPLYDSSGPSPQQRVSGEGGGGGTQRPPTAPPTTTPPRPKAAADTKVIGEMVFGSNSMTYKGSTLKVHHIRDPPQLMVSKMFLPMKPNNTSGEPETFDSLSVQSMAPIETGVQKKETTNMASSVPVDVPVPIEYIPNSPCREDSGIASSLTSSYSSNYSSLTTGGGGGGASSSGGDSSHHKRWRRNQTTSLEYYVNHRQSSAASSSDQLTSSLPARKRPPKLGVAIICSIPEDEEKRKHFLEFFFSHITLIEGHVQRLKLAVERAVMCSQRFIPIVTEGVEQFRDSVWALYSAQRLTQPVWLNMMASSGPDKRHGLCQEFITNFMVCVDKLGSKQFFSSVVTGVLTNHLAWVPTVTPAGATQSRTYLDKHDAKWVDALALTHPYNPLWAQLGDLYGAIGFPLRLSRVVVTGKNANLVKRLLNVLSYFIRCSEMCENLELLNDCKIMNDLSDPTQNASDLMQNSSNTVQESTPGVKQTCELATSEPTTGMNDDERSTPVVPTENCHALLAKLPSDDSKTLLIQRMLHSTSDEVSQEYDDDEKKERSGTVVKNPSPAEFLDQPLDLTETLHSDSVGNVSSQTAVEGRTSEYDYSSRTLHRFSSQDNDTAAVSQRDGVDWKGEVFDTLQCSDNMDTKKETMDTNPGAPITRCRLSTASIPDTCKRENVRALGRDSPMLGRDSAMLETQSCHEQLPSISCTKDPSLYPLNLTEKPVTSIRKKLTLDIKSAQAIPIDMLSSNEELESYLDPSISLGPVETRPHELSCEDIQLLDTVPLPDMDQLNLQIPHFKDCTNKLTPSEGTKTPTIQRSPDEGEVKDEGQGQRSAISPSIPRGFPGRCRPRAPSRARHLSTASTTVDGQLDRYTEIPMPSTEPMLSKECGVPFERNFGRSLLAGFSDRYLSDFVLHGTSDQNFQTNMYTDLSMAVQNSVLDERISESVCLVADTDKLTVKGHTCQYASSARVYPVEVQASSLVSGILTAVHQLAKLKMRPEFCVMHLEDRLQEIYFKSKMLAEFINVHKRIDKEQISKVLRVDASDVPLLMAVAGTHSPHLYMGLL